MSTTDTLAYRCPHCHAVVDAREDLIGSVVDCPTAECGRPFRLEAPVAAPMDAEDARSNEHHTLVKGPSDDESNLETVHPAMIRRHVGQSILIVALLGLGIAALVAGGLFGQGLTMDDSEIVGAGILLIAGAVMTAFAAVVLLTWWIQARMTTLIVTSERTIFRRGIFSRETSEVRHADVRNLQVDQSLAQRMLGIGDLAISSSGQDDLEIMVRGIPNPGGIAEIVRNRQ